MAVDSDPGVGVGTPAGAGAPGAVVVDPALPNIVGATGEFDCFDPAVPLPLYAQVIGYDECAFFGVNRDDPPAVHSNKPMWRKSERDVVVHYLMEAQAEIEQVCRYPLRARWYADEEHDYGYPVSSRWTRVIEAGIEARSSISADEGVDHTADPAEIGPIVTTLTDASEIYVYHPGTCTRIYPSNVDITSGNLTIEIPRCRLLTEDAYADYGVDYDNTAPGGPFEQTVDVVRVYNDATTHGELIWSHDIETCPSCTGSTRDACMTIINGEIGEIDVMAATYSAGTWTSQYWSCYCTMPDRVSINYRAGLPLLTAQARDAVIRLAHAKMPHYPCNVEPPTYMWRTDTEIPRVLTRERLNCRFGLQNGAWAAWMFAKSMSTIRGYTL